MTTPISQTKYSSQNIDNMSFDEDLKVKVTELVDTSGNLINPATEETLQAVAGLNYDNLLVDTTASDSIVITKKLGVTVVDVKTINIV